MYKNHSLKTTGNNLFLSIALISTLVLLPCVSCQTSNTWEADGVIGTDEYANTKTISLNFYELYWNTDDEYIYIGIKVKTQGFVAIGFNPAGGMINSDVIFGWVKDGITSIYDMYITDYAGNHPLDTDLGGTNDITEYGLTESNGYTTMEFKRALNTGDKYDHEITLGSKNIVTWSYGNSDDDLNIHTDRGVINITF